MVNKFFQGGKGIGSKEEQNLLQSLVNEVIQIGGCDFLYLPRSIVKLDQLFREDYLSEFTKKYTIEMFVDNFQGFEGDGELIGQFGFSYSPKLRLIVSQERFEMVTDQSYPKEGDLLYYATSDALFELKHVDDDIPFFPLGTRQTFTLTCEAFKYSNEVINTGTDADSVAIDYGNDGVTIKDPFANNTVIKDTGYGVIDFSESNPFGRP